MVETWEVAPRLAAAATTDTLRWHHGQMRRFRRKPPRLAPATSHGNPLLSDLTPRGQYGMVWPGPHEALGLLRGGGWCNGRVPPSPICALPLSAQQQFCWSLVQRILVSLTPKLSPGNWVSSVALTGGCRTPNVTGASGPALHTNQKPMPTQQPCFESEEARDPATVPDRWKSLPASISRAAAGDVLRPAGRRGAVHRLVPVLHGGGRRLQRRVAPGACAGGRRAWMCI